MKQDNPVTPPKVSIGMPVYNGEKFICDALDSLLAQTFSDFELIISDNGSTDGTGAICREYEKNDSRIRYVRQPENRGATANFQFVLDEARGEYFMWAAHDDMWSVSWLEILMENINVDDISVRGGVHYLEEGKIISSFYPSSFFSKHLLSFFLEDETRGRAHHIYGLFFKAKLLKAGLSQLPEFKYTPDVLQLYHLLHYGNMRTINDTFSIYRRHSENAGITYAQKYMSLSRIMFAVHPFCYYKDFINLSKGLMRVLIVMILPYKHIRSQLYLWWRGFKKVVLGMENI